MVNNSNALLESLNLLANGQSDNCSRLSDSLISDNNLSVMTIDNLRNDSIFFNQTLCEGGIPDVSSYFAGLGGYGIALIVCGVLAVILILSVSLSTIVHVVQNGEHKSRVIFILTAYPVISLCLLCSLIVPRASLIVQAATQIMFTFSMYQLFCLFISYCGGETHLVRSVKPEALNLRVGPCCCCCKLPVYTPNKKNLRFLRLLVLQLPIVHALTYTVFLIVWSDNTSSVIDDIYMQPVLLCSVLFGIWGVTMTYKMLETRLEGHKLALKFLSLQCLVLLTKIQEMIMNIILSTGVIPCYPPLTPTLVASVIFQSIFLLEIVILSFWARSLYKKCPSESEIESLQQHQVCSVQVISTNNEDSERQNNAVVKKSSNNSTCFDDKHYVVDSKM